MKVSLIITTYNWPEALKVTLRSVADQSRPPDEIIIADDGSGQATQMTVEGALGPTDLRWCHVRHGDDGIRQARIKNLGVRYSRGTYLIFIDHDVPLHPDFVSDHVSGARQGQFLQGKRCFLPEGMTRRALEGGSVGIPSPYAPGIGNRKNALRCLPLGTLLSRPKAFQRSLRGCNLSMRREDFIRVDGYDESFDQLWGREDSDICYRLFHNGVRIRNLWFTALQYHLHHRVIKREGPDRLDEELDRIIREKRKRALKGFSTLSSEGGIVAASPGF